MNSAQLQRECSLRVITDAVLEQAASRGATLRVMGSYAVQLLCPGADQIFACSDRRIKDLDFAGYSRERAKIDGVFGILNCEEDRSMRFLEGRERRRFYWPTHELMLDLYLDSLRMCHSIPFDHHLEKTRRAISPTHLLLHKLQVMPLTRFPFHRLDALLLLKYHDVQMLGGSVSEIGIDGEYIARVCGRDWGLWKTVDTNIRRLLDNGRLLSDLGGEEGMVREKLKYLLDALECGPKSLRWHLRAWVGTRVRWYQMVEDSPIPVRLT